MKPSHFLLILLSILSGYIHAGANPVNTNPPSESKISAPADFKSELIDLLNNLKANSNVELFNRHCASIINVVSSQSSFTDSELSFLEAMYFTFSDTSIAWNACNLSTYTARKRPFIISWESPADKKVSVAWLLLPENWEPDKTYPLYVSLHGLYQPYSNEIEYMTRYFRPDSIANKSFEDGYTLFPWGRGNIWYEGIGESDVWESIDAVEKLVKINTSRKYLMGHSMGGYGTWAIAVKHPEPWAAIGIMAGALWYNNLYLNASSAEKLKSTPVYIVCGDKDGLLSDNETAFNLLENAGNANIKFVTFPGGHESLLENWINMYNWIKNFSLDTLTEAENKIVPLQSSLYNNYPNPFNPSTLISYQLPVSGHVELKVFDMLGREVTVLVNQEQKPGKYSINFSAESCGNGSNLASGVYLYKLKITSNSNNNFVFTNTKKMILIK